MSRNADQRYRRLVGWLPFVFPLAMLAMLGVNLYAFSFYQSPAAAGSYRPLRLRESDRRPWALPVYPYWFYYAVQDQLRGAQLVIPREFQIRSEDLIPWSHLGLVDPVSGPLLVVEQAKLASLLSSMRLYRYRFAPRTGIDAAVLDRIEHETMLRRYAKKRRAQVAKRRPSGRAPVLTPSKSLWLPDAPGRVRGERFYMVALRPDDGSARPVRFVVLSEQAVGEYVGSVP